MASTSILEQFSNITFVSLYVYVHALYQCLIKGELGCQSCNATKKVEFILRLGTGQRLVNAWFNTAGFHCSPAQLPH